MTEDFFPKRKECVSFNDSYCKNSVLKITNYHEPFLDCRHPKKISQWSSQDKTENLGETCSMFDRMKQKISGHLCCCVKPTDSQTNCKESNPTVKSTKNIENGKSKSKLYESKHEQNCGDTDGKNFCQNHDIVMSCLPGSNYGNMDCLPKSKHESCCKKYKRSLSKFCYSVKHKSKGKNRKITPLRCKRSKSKETKVYTKQIYELSEEEIKSLKEKGCIKLNVKVKPGVSISDFNIIIKKETSSAANGRCEEDQQ